MADLASYYGLHGLLKSHLYGRYHVVQTVVQLARAANKWVHQWPTTYEYVATNLATKVKSYANSESVSIQIETSFSYILE